MDFKMMIQVFTVELGIDQDNYSISQNKLFICTKLIWLIDLGDFSFPLKSLDQELELLASCQDFVILL